MHRADQDGLGPWTSLRLINFNTGVGNRTTSPFLAHYGFRLHFRHVRGIMYHGVTRCAKVNRDFIAIFRHSLIFTLERQIFIDFKFVCAARQDILILVLALV